MERRDERILRMIQHARPWQLGALLRRVFRYHSEEHEVRGLKLWLDPSSNVGYRLLHYGDLEPDMTAGIERILRPGDVFVDLGGNEGWFSLIAGKRVGPKGRALCVEPQERLWPTVLRNFRLNDLPQCELVPVAVGTQAKAEITLAPSVNTGASSMATTSRKPLVHKRQEVLMRPLDALVDERGIAEVRLMKVDIEGYELHAMRSARGLLQARRIKHILIEFHDAQLAALGQSRQEILALFAECGYKEISVASDIHHFSCE